MAFLMDKRLFLKMGRCYVFTLLLFFGSLTEKIGKILETKIQSIAKN